ncbi:unnamed protein product, partial [Ixodes pacificus]
FSCHLCKKPRHKCYPYYELCQVIYCGNYIKKKVIWAYFRVSKQCQCLVSRVESGQHCAAKCSRHSAKKIQGGEKLAMDQLGNWINSTRRPRENQDRGGA